MKIYIGKDYEGNPISVLLAESREKADIAWAGMKDTPHNVEEIDPNDTSVGVHGLVFLLTSTLHNSKDYPSSHRLEGVNFSKWKRGL